MSENPNLYAANANPAAVTPEPQVVVIGEFVSTTEITPATSPSSINLIFTFKAVSDEIILCGLR